MRIYRREDIGDLDLACDGLVEFLLLSCIAEDEYEPELRGGVVAVSAFPSNSYITEDAAFAYITEDEVSAYVTEA